MRKSTILLIYTEEEKRFIIEEAKRHSLHINEFFLKCIHQKKLVDPLELSEVIRQQKIVGNTLVQIGKLAKMDQLSEEKLQPFLDEHIKSTELIGKLVNEVMSWR